MGNRSRRIKYRTGRYPSVPRLAPPHGDGCGAPSCPDCGSTMVPRSIGFDFVLDEVSRLAVAELAELALAGPLVDDDDEDPAAVSPDELAEHIAKGVRAS